MGTMQARGRRGVLTAGGLAAFGGAGARGARAEAPAAPPPAAPGPAPVAAAAAAAPAAATARPAAAPASWAVARDGLEGYSVRYPGTWTAVTTANTTRGVFLRNPFNIEENLFVNYSSPSSSNYSSVRELGSPEDAAKDVIDRYLQEFMSTRLGIRRESEIVRSGEREGSDGRLYYDVVVRIKSFAAPNQYGLTQEERVQSLEWDRTQMATFGVANKRLYELRIQVPSSRYATDEAQLQEILNNFELFAMEPGRTML